MSPEPDDAARAERNRRICLLRRNGMTYTEIAVLEGISRVRVAQIVARATKELADDAGRAEIESLLEYAERKCVQLIEDPGFVAAPTGRVVTDPDGRPVENKTVADSALRTLLLVTDRKARLYGWDRPVKRAASADPGEGMAAAAAAVEEIRREFAERERALAERERALAERERRTVTGQVVRGELETGR